MIKKEKKNWNQANGVKFADNKGLHAPSILKLMK